MSEKKKKVYIRLSVDFLVPEEAMKRHSEKYLTLVDKDNKDIAEGELYIVGYELEDGTECGEEGEPL